MKKMFLLGDSIRIGYESLVRQKLKDRAVVFSSVVNGEFAQYTLRHVSEWAGQSGYAEDIDLVHWNNGLWDCLRLYGDECLTPVEVYVSTLRRIYQRINVVFPKAAIIFALSTPVIEEKYGDPQRFSRLNRDIKEYNAAASQVMRELKVPVNDLYTTASGFGAEQYADATHFTREGYDTLANAVAKAAEPYLGSQ